MRDDHSGDPDGHTVIEQLVSDARTWVGAFGDHPAPQTLEAYAEMDLEPRRFEAIQRHVSTCRLCFDTVERYDALRHWVHSRDLNDILPSLDELAWCISHRHTDLGRRRLETVIQVVEAAVDEAVGEAAPDNEREALVAFVVDRLMGLQPMPATLMKRAIGTFSTRELIHALIRSRRSAARRSATRCPLSDDAPPDHSDRPQAADDDRRGPR